MDGKLSFMTRVAKIILGIYLATLFIVFVLLAVILLPLHLGILKFLLSLLIAPLVLAVLFSPFFLIWSEENNLSGKWRIVFSLIYTVIWLAAASIFVYQFLNMARPLKNPVFESRLTADNLRIEVTNQSDSIYYSCRFLLTSKGDKITFAHFFSPLVYRKCDRGLATKDFLDCQLTNRLLSAKFKPRTSVEIFDPRTLLKLDLSEFYLTQSLPEESFTGKFSSQDISHLTVVCKSEQGAKVFQKLSVERTASYPPD